MAFVRKWQYPFELNFDDDIRGKQFTGWNTTWPEASDDPFTGDRALRKSGVCRNYFGRSIGSPGTDDVRGAFAWRSNLSSDSAGNILALYSEGDGYQNESLSVNFYKNEGSVKLWVGGIVRQEVSVMELQHANLYHRDYSHIGFHNIGGSRFVMWINGEPIIDYTNAIVPSDIEFVGTGASSPTGWTPYLRIDDFYIDTAVGESIAIPPTYRFMYSNTNGDGTSQDWASKSGGSDYQEVDDTVIDDDDSYVWIGSSGSPEWFNTTNLTILDGHSIIAAIPVAVARKGTATLDSELQLGCDDGTTVYGTAQNLSTWYAEVWDRFTTDPSGAGWTQTSFNANEFGMRTQGTV
jgi:hypothetical protein